VPVPIAPHPGMAGHWTRRPQGRSAVDPGDGRVGSCGMGLPGRVPLGQWSRCGLRHPLRVPRPHHIAVPRLCAPRDRGAITHTAGCPAQIAWAQYRRGLAQATTGRHGMAWQRPTAPRCDPASMVLTVAHVSPRALLPSSFFTTPLHS